MTRAAYEAMHGVLVALLGPPHKAERGNDTALWFLYATWNRKVSASPFRSAPHVSVWWESRGVVVSVGSDRHENIPHLIVAPSVDLLRRIRRSEVLDYFRRRLAAMQRIPRWKVHHLRQNGNPFVFVTVHRHDTAADLVSLPGFRRGITLTTPEIALDVARAVMLPEAP